MSFTMYLLQSGSCENLIKFSPFVMVLLLLGNTDMICECVCTYLPCIVVVITYLCCCNYHQYANLVLLSRFLWLYILKFETFVGFSHASSWTHLSILTSLLILPRMMLKGSIERYFSAIFPARTFVFYSWFCRLSRTKSLPTWF